MFHPSERTSMPNHPIGDRSFRTSVSASPCSISFLLPKAQSCTATAASTTKVGRHISYGEELHPIRISS